MHPEARDAVQRIAGVYGLMHRKDLSVLDLGGRNVNGSLKDLFVTNDWTAIDSTEGDGVDIVADARTWTPDRFYDLVLSTEVFEHLPGWPAVLATAERALKAGGPVLRARVRRMIRRAWPTPSTSPATTRPACCARSRPSGGSSICMRA